MNKQDYPIAIANRQHPARSRWQVVQSGCGLGRRQCARETALDGCGRGRPANKRRAPKCRCARNWPPALLDETRRQREEPPNLGPGKLHKNLANWCAVRCRARTIGRLIKDAPRAPEHLMPKGKRKPRKPAASKRLLGNISTKHAHLKWRIISASRGPEYHEY